MIYGILAVSLLCGLLATVFLQDFGYRDRFGQILGATGGGLLGLFVPISQRTDFGLGTIVLAALSGVVGWALATLIGRLIRPQPD